MATASRPQRRYDHRLRELVQRTGDLTIATDLGVPRSTARGWLGAAPTVVVTLDVADLTEPELRQEILKLRRRVEKLAALLRLALTLLHTSEFRLSGYRRAVSRTHLAALNGENSRAKSPECPEDTQGNRQMRRVLNQAANAAVKAKGTIFAIVYRRLVPRLGHAQAIGAITHRLCRSDLEDPARARAVRGTRASRQRRGEEGAGAQDDPRTAKSRLSRRTSSGSIEQPGMIGRDFRPWLIRAAA